MQTITKIKGTKVVALKLTKVVGAGRVVPFPQPNTEIVSIPTRTNEKDIEAYRINGDSMESGDITLHIGDGWIVVCRFKFEPSEIFLYPCLVRINGKDEAIKWISRESGERVILTCNNPNYPAEIYDADCVEILAVAESVTRSNRK